MTNREKAKAILTKMATYMDDVASPEEVDSWTDAEVEYFITNYEQILN